MPFKGFEMKYFKVGIMEVVWLKFFYKADRPKFLFYLWWANMVVVVEEQLHHIAPTIRAFMSQATNTELNNGRAKAEEAWVMEVWAMEPWPFLKLEKPKNT